MYKEFVPYELAVKLKALGFDEEGFGTYNVNGEVLPLMPYTVESKAILFQQAFRWFREKNYYVTITPYINLYSKPFGIDIEFVYETGRMEFIYFTGDSDYFETYEEAELACLTKLIEIVETRTK